MKPVDGRFHKRNISSDEYAANGIAMSVQKFGGGMKNEMNAIPEWLLQIRCGKCVIYRYKNLEFFCKSGDDFQIDAVHGRVSWCFDMDHLNFRVADQEVFCFY